MKSMDEVIEARLTRCMEELPLILAAYFLLLHGLMWLAVLVGMPMVVMPDWMMRWAIWLITGSAHALLWLWGVR